MSDQDVWALGDYAAIAERLEPVADAVVDAAGDARDRDWLDVAAGTGNVAVRAARAGARVTATDLSPGLVAQGRRRTAAEGLDVEWGVADVQDLPVEDGTYDVVSSVFGAIFAPDHDKVASELHRVLRPGGTLAMTAWTPTGAAQAINDVTARLFPPQPGAPMSDWGVEERARKKLGAFSEVRIETRTLEWGFESAEAAFEFFDRVTPPWQMLKAKVDADVWAEVREEFLDTTRRAMAPRRDGLLAYDPDYLLIVATV
jgi:SAM-dependent methyltransferase